jgi:putative hemolysin
MADLMADRLTDVALPRVEDPYRVRVSDRGNVSGLLEPLEELSALSSEEEERLERLTRVCIDDVISAFGLDGVRRGRAVLESLARRPARRLACQVLTYDRIVGESGLRAGGAWALGKLSREASIEGQEDMPRGGPLLLVSNHPGLADAVALFATTPREDLRVIAADRPFLDALPNTSRHLLTVADAPGGRSGVVRTAARHLRGGGTVLTFPGGRIEPDPAVLPGAVRALEFWSSSADLFARLTPGLAVVPVVVSGVISPSALRIPLTHLRRHKRDREWLAATLQMLIPALRNVHARVRFGRPIYAEPGASVGAAVIEETQRIMENGQSVQ